MSRRDRREQEFSEFFVACAPGLRRTAFLVVRDWHLAEDLTQQALAKLYAAWGRTDPTTRLAYARRTVVNECLSHLRRKRPEQPTEELPDRGVPPHHDHDHDHGLDLGEALSLLAPRQRAIVALRFLDDLSVADVAGMLDVTEGTVKSQTARALDTLRRHLPALVPALAGLPSSATDPEDHR